MVNQMINAKYTIVLKTLLDDEKVKPLIDKAMSTYPMYSPQHDILYSYIPTRDELNKKILNFYKYREIGFETVGRFLDELETSLNEIMPYYNQLYKSVDIMNNIDDIFGNVDIVESYEEEITGTSKDTSKGESTGTSKDTSNGETNSEAHTSSTTNSDVNGYNKRVDSTMPQDDISLKNSDINSVSYADKIEWNNNSSHDTATNEGTDTTNATTTNTTNSETNSSMEQETEKERKDITTHTLTRKGNQGVNTYAHDMLEFRELFRNIEQEIINNERIRELFMLVY